MFQKTVALRNLAITLAVLCVSACASSEASRDFESAAEIDLQQIVCRSVKPTGSRLSKRVCKTKGEWIAEREASEELMRNRDRGPASPTKLPTIGN